MLQSSLVTIPEAFAIAVQHHQAGRLAEAEAAYRQILAVQPQHADSLHWLGVLAHQAGRNQVAAELIQKAIAMVPTAPAFHSNLGVALAELGRLDEAIAAFQMAIQLKPDYPEAYNDHGVTLGRAGRIEEAAAAYRRAIELRPSFPEAVNNLGAALIDLGRFDEAVVMCRQALQLKPQYPEAQNNLGNALRELGHLDQAVIAYRRALEFKPDYAKAHNNLGVALTEQGRLGEAIALCQRAIQIKPDYAEAHYNLGNAFREQGQLDEAIAAYRRALQLKPDYRQAQGNLANALKDQGHLSEAVEAYRRSIEIQPDCAKAHSNLLLCLHYLPDLRPEQLFLEHCRWDEAHGRPADKRVVPHGNLPVPERRLRIGYVSPDFRKHSVAFFLEGLLAAHNRARVEVFCYADQLREDEFTKRFQQHDGQWRRIAGMNDGQVTNLIREDGIDILVDLAGHTAHNRMLVFARKPAPVQVSYLGYCDTTGLRTMDYRLTDAFADPPGTGGHLHAEQLIRLPDVFACFRPAAESPPVQPLPALTGGHVTFAGFHALPKLNVPLLEVWARILLRVAGSRLLMAGAGLNEESQRRRLRDFFGAKGIDAARLEFKGRQPLADYLALHDRVDVMLDSHPFTGHTITCHALWMGVPVVTLAGKTHCARMVGSVLSTLGLPELIGGTADQYVEIAVKLAGDLPRLAELRATLRERMRNSPLTDAPRLARNVEDAYRLMWSAWCMRQLATPLM